MKNINWNKYSKIFFYIIAGLELLSRLDIIPFKNLHNFTKPMLMPALAWVFYTQIRPHYINKFIYAAIFFAWLGDIALMFTDKSPYFFSVGLGFFLIMQLCYIFIFRGFNKINFLQKLEYAIPIVIIGILVMYFVLPNSGALKIPIVLYFLAILGMVLSALGMWHQKKTVSAQMVFLGAVLFMVSDSLIALNKFAISLPLASFFIMLTYILAQYFIIGGLGKR